MKVNVDFDICEANAMCEAYAPEVFEVDDDDLLGRRDEVFGEQPVAIVVLKDGAELEQAELDDYCRQRLAGYKVPRGLHIIESLPRNSIGKVTKGTLRDLVNG